MLWGSRNLNRHANNIVIAKLQIINLYCLWTVPSIPSLNTEPQKTPRIQIFASICTTKHGFTPSSRFIIQYQIWNSISSKFELEVWDVLLGPRPAVTLTAVSWIPSAVSDEKNYINHLHFWGKGMNKQEDIEKFGIETWKMQWRDDLIHNTSCLSTWQGVSSYFIPAAKIWTADFSEHILDIFTVFPFLSRSHLFSNTAA